MRYYIRNRGEDSLKGPFSTEELKSALDAGIISSNDVAMCDEGQSPDQLRKYWNYEWVAITQVAGLERCSPLTMQGSSEAPTNTSGSDPFGRLLGILAIICLFFLVWLISWSLGDKTNLAENIILPSTEVLVFFVLPYYVIAVVRQREPKVHQWLACLFPLGYVVLFFMVSTYIPSQQITQGALSGMRANQMRIFPTRWAIQLWQPMRAVDYIIFQGKPFWTVGSLTGDELHFRVIPDDPSSELRSKIKQ